MADFSNYRIAAYIVTILVHMSNIGYMAMRVRHMNMKGDPKLKDFLRLQPRYFTCWNFGLQVIYATIALFCEILMSRNSNNKSYKLNAHLRGLRDTLFAGIVWPSTLLVFSVFWGLYILDRELIFPEFADKALTPISNHVIHTLIVPIIIWEVIFRPRSLPKSHKRNINHLLFYLFIYFCVLAYTYKECGSWIYPIFSKLYGTVYFPISILIMVLMCLAFYYIQWAVTGFIWGRKPLSMKNK